MGRLVTALALVLVSPCLAVIGYGAGALSLTGVEPGGMFVECGPAVFGRPSPLPDPSCAGAYAPLPEITYGLFVLAVAAAIVGLAMLTVSLIRLRRPVLADAV